MTPVLESERLYYKPVSEEHLSFRYVNWMNDKSVIQYLESGGDYTLDKLREYICQVAKQNEILFWAIHLNATHKHIGNIKIDAISKKHGIGQYSILMGDKEEWGKGYAQEASQRIIQYCCIELHLRKITLGVVANNTAAVALYKKIGFEVEGIFKKHGFYNSELCNVLSMAFFNPDYKIEKR